MADNTQNTSSSDSPSIFFKLPEGKAPVTIDPSSLNTMQEIANIQGLGSFLNPLTFAVGNQNVTFLPKTNSELLKKFMDFYSALDRTNKNTQISLGELIDQNQRTATNYDVNRRRLLLDELLGIRRLQDAEDKNRPSLLQDISATAGTASDLRGLFGGSSSGLFSGLDNLNTGSTFVDSTGKVVNWGLKTGEDLGTLNIPGLTGDVITGVDGLLGGAKDIGGDILSGGEDVIKGIGSGISHIGSSIGHALGSIF